VCCISNSAIQRNKAIGSSSLSASPVMQSSAPCASASDRASSELSRLVAMIQPFGNLPRSDSSACNVSGSLNRFASGEKQRQRLQIFGSKIRQQNFDRERRWYSSRYVYGA
jgi:hypothetical protein